MDDNNKSGMEEADLTQLLEDYGDAILRLCYLYLGDIHLAQDAVQDTFIRVYQNYGEFRKESSVKTWIVRIAVNVCKNYRRTAWFRLGRSRTAFEEEDIWYEDKIKDDTLIQEVMSLSSKYKEVILLYYYQELKMTEIAAALNIPLSTVAIRLKRGREKLKQRLEGWYFDEA